MAQQLLLDRTPAAYAALKPTLAAMPREDAGLGRLVVGYAHTRTDYAKAIDPLNRAKAGASELGDYVADYLATPIGKPGTMRRRWRRWPISARTFPTRS